MSNNSTDLSDIYERLTKLESQLPKENQENQEKKEKKEKKPREPTQYQIFMGTEIKKVKEQNPELSHKDAFKIAATNWKKE